MRKIGSLLYAAVYTRPDIAFAVSRLARFNLNPSEKHHEAAQRGIRYLLHTRNYGLILGGEDTLEAWSDASFADNTLDRKSSQASYDGCIGRLQHGTEGKANPKTPLTGMVRRTSKKRIGTSGRSSRRATPAILRSPPKITGITYFVHAVHRTSRLVFFLFF